MKSAFGKKFVMFAMLLGCIAAQAQPQTYPSRPVTMVVAQAPGGGNDAVARVLAQKLSEALGQQFVVTNRPGAGGNIGSEFVARAPKDGYTIFMTSSSHTINPALYSRVPYDAVKDFTPIALVAKVPFTLVVNPAVPARTMMEFIALAKQKAGAIQFASAGNGTLNHLLGEMLKMSAGINMSHVPYKGSAAAANDVIAGHVPVSFNSMTAALPFIKSGQMRALGVSSGQRTALAPEIPAIAETIPGFDTVAWYGLVAPAGTPKAIVDLLAVQVAKILATPEAVSALAIQGAEASFAAPPVFEKFIANELKLWAVTVKQAGAQVD